MRVSDVEVLAAGAHDWFDELAVGIFITPFHQLWKRLTTIRCLIIRASEVEWTNGIVCRTNQVDAVEAQAGLFDRVADRGGFRGRDELAEAMREVEHRRDEP